VSGRLRVLFFSSRFLFPQDTGGKIRTAKLLEGLKERWAVSLLSGFDPATDGSFRAAAEALGDRFLPVERRPPARASGWRRPLRRLGRAASLTPLSVQYETLPAFRQALARELQAGAYDLFVCDFLQPTANVPRPCPCASLLFAHNVESRITRRQARLAEGLAQKALWLWQHGLTSRYEGTVARRFDRVVAVSASDREELEGRFGLRNVREIPTGVDAEAFHPSGLEPETDHVVFCGSMDWLPNQDAVRWFVAEVLPRVVGARPGARLTVVGRNPPPELVAATAGEPSVRFTGRVEDVRPWLERASCVVVPLRIGGGTRIKIYEALAMERPVVSTSVGAEGLPIEDGQHYLLADGAEAFAGKVVECLARPEEARAVARAARLYVARRFGWDRVADAFAAIGREAVEARAGRGR